MAPLSFVDTHVHFWDHGCEDVRWDWLRLGEPHPVFGRIDPIMAPRYRPEELLAEVGDVPVRKVVHVQAAIGTPDPVAETRWLEETAARAGMPNAIVAHADLRSPSIRAELERHARASSRLRGIRDFADGDYLRDPDYARGLRALSGLGLLAELDCRVPDMAKARDLATACPATTIVVEHAGFPTERTPEYFSAWAAGMTALAEADNVYCKISGLGMGDPTWTAESIRPYVEHCFQTFGVNRCVFGTNWPVDRLFSDYVTVIGAYSEIIDGLSSSEQRSLWTENAQRLYRI